MRMVSKHMWQGAMVAVALALTGVLASATDWPQWRGPLRDGICREKGLLKEWPSGGPRLLWKAAGFGTGYSSVAIVGGKLYTMGDVVVGDRGKAQCVVAFDLTTRKRLWTAPVGPPNSDGSRCTPTVSAGLVYGLGTDGDLVCVRAADGSEVWRTNIERDLGGRMMSGWKYSESPLVDGELLIVTPGMPESTLVALQRRTGKLVWRCAAGNIGPRGADGAGYSSAVATQVGPVKLYVQQYGRGVIGVEANSGRLLWSYNGVACSTANIPTPVVKSGLVFVSNAYGAGSACLKMESTGAGVSVRELYKLSARTFQNHHGGVVCVGDYIYGGHGQNAGDPTCLELRTGKIAWQARAPGRGSAAVLSADGMLYFRYDNGVVALIPADPSGCRVVSTFQEPPIPGPAWPHPVIADGRLYLRRNETVLCYDVRGSR